MPTAKPETVMCTYRIAAEKDEEFVALLRRHWPTLHRLGVVTDRPPMHFRGLDGPDQPFYVEIFEWRDADAFKIAHEHPEVLAIWEPMERMAEGRSGRPGMEFPHVEPLDFGIDQA